MVAADHDDAQEGADDGGAEKDQDDRYPDGPDARGENVLERVVRVDKGLCESVSECGHERARERVVWFVTYHEQSPDGVVDENEGGGQEHGEADEFVELQ